MDAEIIFNKFYLTIINDSLKIKRSIIYPFIKKTIPFEDGLAIPFLISVIVLQFV